MKKNLKKEKSRQDRNRDSGDVPSVAMGREVARGDGRKKNLFWRLLLPPFSSLSVSEAQKDRQGRHFVGLFVPV